VPNQRQLTELIQLGREERVLEHKRSSPFGNIRQKIIRTSLGMANCRDGGTIVVSVSQLSSCEFVTDGVIPADSATYDPDQIQEAINQYADPYVRIEVHRVEIGERNFVAIVIHEFDDIPVLCKKDDSELRHGAVYTRSYRKPETCEVRSQTEMREIIELAVDKGVKGFIRRMHAAGAKIEAGESEAQKFENQLKGF
jgi:predicted HTH transcriptional regulator